MMHGMVMVEGLEPDEVGDPPYISNLLSREVEHSCYFLVGNPLIEKPERIGVVPAMLMAHSLVLRRALSQQETELNERWDFKLTQISPRTFRRLLKFAYGYNKIKEYNVQETVELLKAGDFLVMHPMIVEASKHIVNIMNTSNICQILQDQVCLDYTKTEQEIHKLITSKTKEVFEAENLQLVCPAGMRYILMLENLQKSQVALFRGVVKWARRKVLKDLEPTNEFLSPMVEPCIVVPCLKHTRLCLFNLVAVVEEALIPARSDRDFFSLLSSYHHVNVSTPVNTVSVCNVDSSGKTIVHNAYDIKLIYDCAIWTDADLLTTTELVIQTPVDRGATLHAIYCTGLSRKSGTIEDLFKHLNVSDTDTSAAYECKCTVTTSLVNDTEKVEISKVQVCQTALFEEEFKILLSPDLEEEKNLWLAPNSKYVMDITFVVPHPFWYSTDIEDFRPGEKEDLIVGCGVANKEKKWYGSHIKSLLYKRDAVTP